ncbi:MAG: sigma-54-dependent transcriptional regulator [Myxococcaceae bacterium]
MTRLLIVDDQPALREGMAASFVGAAWEVATADSGKVALAEFRKKPADLVVTDLKMDGMDGIALTRELRALDPEVAVLIVTAHGTIEAAVAAIREGAFDFVLKPFSPEVLRSKVTQGLALRHTRQELERQTGRIDALEASAAKTLVGESEPIRALRARIQKAATSEATVLLLGESGTGKELAARELHALSPRSKGPFVAVHCAALAETLLESELFGHERGAFTGAIKRKLGRFELATGGTLFFDEIGEVPLSVQTKLLRVLQERDITRVGGEAAVQVDVRVVAATHRDLPAEVKAGRFREDLFYRLHVVPLHLPPLRERPDDIPLLAQHFIAKHARRMGRPVKRLDASASEGLLRYAWPGNVRELENAIEQALVFCESDTLLASDLPAFLTPQSALGPKGELPVPRGELPLPALLDALEKQLIEEALARAKGVKTEAARLLGVKTSALYYKLEKYGLIPKGTQSPSEN